MRHAGAVLLLASVTASFAHAQSCGASVSGNIDFGIVNTDANNSVIGQIRVWCNGAGTPYVRACVALGAPEGASFNPRYMIGPAGPRMTYNFYSDATYTSIWGDGSTPQAPLVPVDIAISGGSGEKYMALYARVPPQTGLVSGNYYVNYYGADATLRVKGYTGTPQACSTSWAVGPNFSFGVNAVVDTTCGVTATALSFGTTGSLGAPLAAQGSIAVNCRSGVNYSLALNKGQGAGATIAERRMTRASGSETLRYQLASNSAITTLWGDGTGGTSVVSGTGTGSTQTRQVYGRLIAQPVTAIGLYTDSVTVTITY